MNENKIRCLCEALECSSFHFTLDGWPAAATLVTACLCILGGYTIKTVYSSQHPKEIKQ